jgi:DNA polymerase-3 subunit alpha
MESKSSVQTTNEIVHLHNHSNHSFLDGQASISEMVKRAKELGLDTIALTNHGNIFGWVEFYKECKKLGIKPILGCEFYLTDEHDKKDRHAHHLVVLPENEIGLMNIIKLTTCANKKWHYKPRIDLADLERHSEGLIVLTACMHGPISYWLFDKMTWAQDGEESQLKEAANIPEAYRYARALLRILGNKHLFFEVQDGGIPEQKLINQRVREMAKELGVQTVATQDAHYVNKEDSKAHSFLKAMAFGKSAVEEGSHGFSTEEFYLKNRSIVLNGTDIRPEEVDRTREIAARCNAGLSLGQMRLPQYPSQDGLSSMEQLKIKLRDGWKRRNIKDTKQEYGDRVNYELVDIESAGLADYFLIVSDITDYCRNSGITLGPSRGSAGGSLVSYLLGITQIDPIQYGLIWERFYNAGRKGSMPDIDTDVEKSRRDEVIAYIRKRFGEQRVAQLVTLSSLGAKQVLRDVMRVAGIDENTKSLIAGMIPAKNDDHASISLDEAIAAVPKLKEISEDHKPINIERNGKVIRTTSYKELFDIARRLEGCYKTSGVHAAAVVIADRDFDQAGIPLVKGANKEELICGWDMDAVDAFGLLKVDILGIATLDVLRTALEMVHKRHGKKFDLLNLPLDDSKVFDMLGEGHNQGVFQLESQLGRSWSKKCKPRTVEEIGELVAIIRPACLDTGMADTYAKIKSGDQNPTYIHPILEPILKPTKGILLYQEQVMEICQKVAGMNLKEADAVRKTIGKKKPEELREKQQQFMNGAVKTVPQDIAEQIWSWIEKQAGYGFNKSHAVGYAVMAYWTAWVKANYYVEFLCANLIHAKDKANQQRTPQDVIASFVNDGKLFGVDVVPPRLSSSENDFNIINDKTISFGFSHIRGVGDAAMKAVEACRGAKSFEDFVTLAAQNKMKRPVIDAFIAAGVLDEFNVSRRLMRAQYALIDGITENEHAMLADYPGTVAERIAAIADEDTVEDRRKLKKKMPNVNRRVVLRELVSTFNADSHRDSIPQILQWEKFFLGATLSGSMADLNRAMSGARHTCKQVGANELGMGGKVELCVVVEEMREVTVKKGKTQGRAMAFINLSDSTYTLEGACAFPDTLEEIKSLGVQIGDVVFVDGKTSDRGLIINRVRLV